MRRVRVLVSGAAFASYAAAQVLGRTAGSTRTERRAALPGDGLVVHPQLVTDHAVTIDAPPAEVWPWLTQLGWHLGGWYTPRWVDRLLFPDNWPSLDRLDPLLVRDLRAGDAIPDGPPGTAEYVVDEADPPQLLVLRSTTHVPPGWEKRFGARISWTWTLRLSETGPCSTRVHLRVRGHLEPRWFAALYAATIVPADFVMATGMLQGLRRRVEAGAAPRLSGRQPLPRVDAASRKVVAGPDRVFAALVDPAALAAWLPPSGMSARFEHVDVRPDGSYRMVLTYLDAPPSGGKSSAGSDVVEARFVEIVPGLRVVQEVDFESEDPAFAGTMTMTWSVTQVGDGTLVDLRARGVPPGIPPEDHRLGMASSLANLAAYLDA